MAAWVRDNDVTDLTQDQRQFCQTNPIEEEVSSSKCEVSSEESHTTASAVFCQTKPIGSLDERQVHGGQEVTKN